MIRLIGLRWTHGNMWSREVLIVRGLAFIVVFVLETSNNNQVILIQRSHSSVISKTRLALLSLPISHCCFLQAASHHDLLAVIMPLSFTVSIYRAPDIENLFLVMIARGTHLFPFRTESLSPVAPMVLHLNWCGRVGNRQVL